MIINGTLDTIHDNVLVTNMNFEEQVTASGIIVSSDNGKTEGIKPRWGKVYKVGPDQTDVKLGDWILIEHGRWTRGVELKDDDGNVVTVRRVETKAIIAISDHLPTDINLSASNASTVQEFDFSQPMY
jgi:co-chaperonin GroES (HSP10)